MRRVTSPPRPPTLPCLSAALRCRRCLRHWVTTLRQSALREAVATQSIGHAECPDLGALQSSGDGRADRRQDPATRPSAPYVVQASLDEVATPNQFFGATLAVFGVATIVLLITAGRCRVLLLSGLFGYLLARGLTRRIEAVSRVTTAIAQATFRSARR